VEYHGEVGAAPRFEGNLWIRSEVDGTQHVKIDLDDGFLVLPGRGADAQPSVPLLGQAAFCAAELQVGVDYQNLRFSVHESDRSLVQFADPSDPGNL
jgi:hypothetical protein